jgi:hypothetical protein
VCSNETFDITPTLLQILPANLKMPLAQDSVPKSGLARYRVLSPNAGIHVSPIALGALSIGDKWGALGEMNKESSFKLLDTYFDQGGNFIDTACN